MSVDLSIYSKPNCIFYRVWRIFFSERKRKSGVLTIENFDTLLWIKIIYFIFYFCKQKISRNFIKISYTINMGENKFLK